MLHSALTVISFVDTPLMGVALADDLRSRMLRRRRLTVPLDRHEASVKVISNEIERRDFKGRRGFGLFGDDIVVLRSMGLNEVFDEQIRLSSSLFLFS
jgi:hypothetical protein